MLEPTIGLEIHCELNTKSKMFSGSNNSYTTFANTNISEMDLALPGTLPRPNVEGIRKAIKLALALNCEIPNEVLFDRKNYYYPDLPKGYQLTQMTKPFGKNGSLDIEINNEIKHCYIHQIHLEEDSASMTHESTYSLIDYNRAGVPLIEIVTEPVFTNIDETIEFLENLRMIIKYIGISEASNEKGQLRVDVNISMKEKGSTTLGTRREIKNINSFSTVREVLDYEIKDQTETILNGGTIRQETRRWVDTIKKTVSMRDKVDAIDYRYYIEPNIPTVELTSEFINEIKKSIPTLPIERINKYISLGISKKDAKTLVKEKNISDFFEEMLRLDTNPVQASNYIITRLLGYLNQTNKFIDDIYMKPKMLSDMIKLVENNTISTEQAKQVFNMILEEEKEPLVIVKEHGMEQISDEDTLRKMVNEVLDNNQTQLEQYKSGKTNLIGFFVGQTLKKSAGKANPSIVNKLVNEEINKR